MRPSDPAQPNILFIMTDQHRHDYLSCAGATYVDTPYIDRLAARGVHFTHCFTNAPICAPSRAAFATGLYPHHTGVLDNDTFLSLNHQTIYQHFRDHGYRVGLVGKLDLAKPDRYNGYDGDRPRVYQYGFTHPTECEGKMHAGKQPYPVGPYTRFLQEHGLLDDFYTDYQRRASVGWVRDSNDSVLPVDAYEDVYIGRRSSDWLKQIPADFPWFLQVSFVGPHDPFDPPSEYAKEHRARAVPISTHSDMSGRPDWVKQRRIEMSPEEITHIRRQYCAMIALIDTQVGQLVAVLQERGMLENTIIVFTSDHGEMLGDDHLYDKHVAYEPAIRVPLIMAGRKIHTGMQSHALISLIDIYPTLCDLADIPRPDGLDGQSIQPVLDGRAEQHREVVFTEERHFRAVRTQHHKYIENYNTFNELYDLDADPHERTNIAHQQSDITNTLRQHLRT